MFLNINLIKFLYLIQIMAIINSYFLYIVSKSKYHYIIDQVEYLSHLSK